MQTLTPAQKKCLDFIKKHVEKHGTPPTYEQIAQGLGVSSKSTVHHHVETLRLKGYLTKEHRLSNGITLHTEGNLLPVLGSVAAGAPLDLKNHDERLEVPAFMIRGPGSHFVLRVQGDSMVGDGILDGDYVVVREQKSAENGDLVVAELDDGATIKRFYRKRSYVELHSANPKYKPIVVGEHQSLSIAGIYRGLLRSE